MKLKDRHLTPRGGFYYDDPILHRVIQQTTLKALVRAVETWYKSNSVDIPGDLAELIEDQICQRQPPDRCTYSKKLGDRVSRVIHAVAGAIDKVAGTQLEKKARGCRGCGKRRARLNQLSR